MLVLSRKKGETIVIGSGISITVLGPPGGRGRLGIEAPAEILIQREELQDSIESKSTQNQH